MKHYVVITGESDRELSDNVNAALEMGYDLYGNPYSYTRPHQVVHCQAVTKIITKRSPPLPPSPPAVRDVGQ